MKTLFHILFSLIAGIAAVALTVLLVEKFLAGRRDQQYYQREIN